MVSQTLASAILNQKAPDIVGSFREGQQFAKGQQVEKLTGQALQEGSGQKLQELIGLDPEVGYALAEAIGARSAKELNTFIRDASITENFFKQGNFDQGRQFIQQSRDTASMAGMSTTSHDNLLSIYDNKGPQAAYEHVQGFSAVLNKTKNPSGQQESEFQADALVGAINPSTKKPFTRDQALQEIVLRKSGITARSGMSAQERIASDLSTTQKVADSQAIIKGASAGASEKAKLDEQLIAKPQVEAAIIFAKEQAKNAASALKTGKDDGKALNVYESAMLGLVSSFEDANTGPMQGLLPSIADDDRVLDAAISIMSPVLKSVVRGAGEGTFTDNDQKQIDNLMPTRKDNKEVARKKVELLDSFVRSKLSGAATQLPQNADNSDPLGLR